MNLAPRCPPQCAERPGLPSMLEADKGEQPMEMTGAAESPQEAVPRRVADLDRGTLHWEPEGCPDRPDDLRRKEDNMGS